MKLAKKLKETKSVKAYNAKKLTAIILIISAFFTGGWMVFKQEAVKVEDLLSAFNNAVADDGPKGEMITEEEVTLIREKANQLLIFKWWFGEGSA